MATMATRTAQGTMVLLTRLSRRTWRSATEDVLGMPMKSFATLSTLRDYGGELTQQALGSALCVDANNLVLLLNAVEEAGHADRRRDPADRRRHIVAMTAEGREALAAAEEALGGVEDDVLHGLSPADRMQLHDLLRTALDAPSCGGS